MRDRVGLVVAPIGFALRRMRARPVTAVALTLALASAGGLIGWSSLTAALSQENSVRLELGATGVGERSLRVTYFTLPGEGDYRASAAAGMFRSFADVTGRVRRVQIWRGVAANALLGTRLVVVPQPAAAVELTSGRLPRGCRARVCEAVALSGRAGLGDRVALGRRRYALIVGRGGLRPGLLPDATELGRRAVLVRSLAPQLAPLVDELGSTVVYQAALDPDRVRGFELAALSERLRRAIVRLERGDSLVRATAPLAQLGELAQRGRVARERLLVVAGQGAALILAFAAFVASVRRRETDLVDSQLAALGASRAQMSTGRVVEAAVPSAASVVLAVAGLWTAVHVVARARGFPSGFVSEALPLETILAIAGLGAAGCVLLFVSRTRLPQSRAGVGPLELAAVTALGIVVWQTWLTGGLDPDRVAAGGAGPLLLLVPTLGFFVTAVLLLRALPFVLRVSERVARGGPFTLRLAALTAARRPAQTAAATTFLAIALGSCLFSIDYRATLERQARDQARFTAGANWRVTERGRPDQPDVAPLTRYTRVSSEPPTPVLRLDGGVVKAYPQDTQLPVSVVALPSRRMRDLLVWRDSFSSLSRAEIARRLRPRPIRMAGPRLTGDATALRVWARGETDYPRLLVAHLLLPGQHFAHVRLGLVGPRWRQLRVALPRALRDAQFVGVEFAPTKVPFEFKYDPSGYVDLGPIQQQRSGRWSPLPSLARWTRTEAPDGTAGILLAQRFRRAPVTRGIRFDLNGTRQPLIHPTFGLPEAMSRFDGPPIRGLVSGPVGAEAVDGLVTLDLLGKRIPVRVSARADLFPTIVKRSDAFIVLDYDTLFAALNADRPGLALPTEAWFFKPQPRGFEAGLAEPPFRLEQALGARALEQRIASDPLAAGTRKVLGVAALIAALLGLAGVVLAVLSTLASERLLLAEYEALGVPPVSLRRTAQLRLVALSVLGIVAGVVGAFVSVQAIAGFVAVTATAGRPLPSIVPIVPWSLVGAVVGAVAIAAVTATAVLTARALRETAARRLRA